MPRSKKQNTLNLDSEEEGYHDAVVMQAFAGARKIFTWAERNIDFDPCFPFRLELEYEIVDPSGEKGFADVAFLDAQGPRPFLLLEIKSKREAQSASGWTRQIRRYEKLTRAPAVLVIAHDLGEVQRRYLALAGVSVLDLREL